MGEQTIFKEKITVVIMITARNYLKLGQKISKLENELILYYKDEKKKNVQTIKIYGVQEITKLIHFILLKVIKMKLYQ